MNMKRRSQAAVVRIMFVLVLLTVPFISGCSESENDVAEKLDSLNICQLAKEDLVSKLYKKQLVASGEGKECLWSLKPGGMAYLHITVHERYQELRKYFNENLSTMVKLEKITDLGDEGLMTIAEDSLGVVVIRKGNYVLQSAVTFLDIKPDSEQQKVLWQIYTEILDKL